jgi:cytochrome bd-type quinol oxidase subunit 1
MFAFFLESSFLALLVWGERRLGPRRHFWTAVALFVGSWLSGYFIITTNAFMQHPVGHAVAADGTLHVADLGRYVFNRWAMVQYAHNQVAATVTASFVVAAVGAFWTLRGEHDRVAAVTLRTGVIAGLLSSVLVAFPTGDAQGKLVAEYQPITLAAMEGRFTSGGHAPLAMIGQPNVAERKLDNPIQLPAVLSWIAYGSFSANVRGLQEFPESDWPTSIELLYYSFHIMVGLGTLFILVMTIAMLQLVRRALERGRWLLWTAGSPGWCTGSCARRTARRRRCTAARRCSRRSDSPACTSSSGSCSWRSSGARSRTDRTPWSGARSRAPPPAAARRRNGGYLVRAARDRHRDLRRRRRVRLRSRRAAHARRARRS